MAERTANKIFSFILILVFTFLGLVGLILPIIPGVLFLLIAAIMASRHIPALANYLESNRYTAKPMHLSKRFSNLDFWGKVRFCCWGFLKVTMDSVEWVVATIAKLLSRKSRGRN